MNKIEELKAQIAAEEQRLKDEGKACQPKPKYTYEVIKLSEKQTLDVLHIRLGGILIKATLTNRAEINEHQQKYGAIAWEGFPPEDIRYSVHYVWYNGELFAMSGGWHMLVRSGQSFWRSRPMSREAWEKLSSGDLSDADL